MCTNALSIAPSNALLEIDFIKDDVLYMEKLQRSYPIIEMEEMEEVEEVEEVEGCKRR